MSCNKYWRSYGEKEAVAIHDLEDSHLINIIRYLHTKQIEWFIEEVAGHTDYGDGRSSVKEWIPLMEKEAIRRGLDMEEVLSTFDHPDPEKTAKDKGLIKYVDKYTVDMYEC